MLQKTKNKKKKRYFCKQKKKHMIDKESSFFECLTRMENPT